MNKDLVRDFKWCNHCKQLLSITKFNRNKAQPDGYAYWCKSCRSKDDEYNKEYMKKYDALRYKDRRKIDKGELIMDYQILSEEKWCACQAGEKSVKETFKDLSYFGSDGVWNYYGSITENGITTLMRIKEILICHI